MITWWFLETDDGEWLENEPHGTLTRDPNRALKWPNKTAADDFRRHLRHPWWGLKVTEHKWIAPDKTNKNPPPLPALKEPEMKVLATITAAIATVDVAVWFFVHGALGETAIAANLSVAGANLAICLLINLFSIAWLSLRK